MLDAETKARIDSARDILVGKVPDPKSQVEQITIALIYKFMDDMDRQSEELGGKATFFSGEFKKYGWANLLDKRLSGHERLLLYAEGIEKMNTNKNIPQLFRDIFRGVFLPYRDPETLNLFLKEIHSFNYDHSERLGDAFEYLLSVMDSQGDAGQFRTPRHIIDFIVKVVDPQKNETVLDPACGTAGFLISSFKHIMARNTGAIDAPGADARSSSRLRRGVDAASTSRPGDRLTADERGRLMTNFCGYDISPDMVRLSRVNLYLHGFANPRIHEYDTLTSEERWDERYDVIMANPPFMTPKGGIRPHNRFSIKAKRSEVLFVDYIAEHLNPAGRAGVIVPEGIIFQSQNAYKALRRMLVENYLWAVVSLPAGVFNPYSGVKTSILFLDRTLTKRTEEIMFVKVENDGFDLGAQRRPNGKSDLPGALKAIGDFRLSIPISRKESSTAQSVIGNQQSAMTLRVPRRRLLENPDCNLSGDRYREASVRLSTKWPMVKLGEVCETTSGGTPSRRHPEYFENGTVPWLKSGEVAQGFISNAEEYISELGMKNSSAKLLPENTVLVAMYGATAGKVGLLKFRSSTNQAVCGILPNDRMLPEYLFNVLRFLTDRMVALSGGGAQPNISQKIIRDLEIPLPPLAEQDRIVAQLEGHRKIIEGARQVIANYKPSIRIDPDWPTIELERIAKVLSGGTPSKSDADFWNGSIPWVSPKDMKTDRIEETEDHISKSAVMNSAVNLVSAGAVLCVVRSGILSRSFPVALAMRELTFNQDINAIVVKPEKALPEYLFHLLKSMESIILGSGVKRGGTVHSLQSRFLHQLKIPLPPLSIQRKIVSSLDAERGLVEANRKLIEIFEGKIKARLDEIWGEEDSLKDTPGQ
jgi:type I restriction enzyme M protein